MRLLVFIFWPLLIACGDASPTHPPASGQSPTVLRQKGSRYTLLRYGKPYFIRGAGGVNQFKRLQECGGNSVRLWDDIDARQHLDEAQQLGLSVLLGLVVDRETEGFDYNDQAAVDRQVERIRKTVLAYKDHPALLMWCLGNEWAQDANNFSVFNEVNRLAAMVHQLDPNHPITTAISPDSPRAVWLVQQHCPEIDVLSVNSYGMTKLLPEYLKKGGWTKPYIVSEYGPQAYWEVPFTPWQTPIEPTSTQKAEFLRQAYQDYIGSRPPNCLGAYLFYWGSKQEESHTWFSFFDQQGRETPLVGMMQKLWSSHFPANQAPVVGKMRIDGADSSYVTLPVSPTLHRIEIAATDPDCDSLTYHWEIKPSAQHTADYFDAPVPPIAGLIAWQRDNVMRFKVPQKPGTYRVFVNMYDGHQHVSTANLSLRVRPKSDFIPSLRNTVPTP